MEEITFSFISFTSESFCTPDEPTDLHKDSYKDRTE